MPVIRSLALLLMLIPCSAWADWTCQSGSARVNLLELYTSQGCSSCPPADRWLSAIADRDALWTSIVPVAWHVTYWDYIGWQDPFGRRENDRRQRNMAAASGSQVYTPGMFLNRGEYRGWRRSPPGGVPVEAPDSGILSARASGDTVTVNFEPGEGVRVIGPRVELVFLRSGEHTAVAAGENRGRELRNDFVAGPVSSAELAPTAEGWTATFRAGPDEHSEAVALWVTDGNGTVLQATGRWLP